MLEKQANVIGQLGPVLYTPDLQHRTAGELKARDLLDATPPVVRIALSQTSGFTRIILPSELWYQSIGLVSVGSVTLHLTVLKRVLSTANQATELISDQWLVHNVWFGG